MLSVFRWIFAYSYFAFLATFLNKNVKNEKKTLKNVKKIYSVLTALPKCGRYLGQVIHFGVAWYIVQTLRQIYNT